jgi:Abnormal spindle-like microcephaly-assoc'd, ASPM-SPD-2-Hydin
MQATIKLRAGAVALMLIAVASACTGPNEQSSSGNDGSKTSAQGTGTNATASGTNTSGRFTNTTTTSRSASSKSSKPSTPTTYNQVVLGGSFIGQTVSFGRVLIGGSATLPFLIHNGLDRAVEVVMIATSSSEFTPSAECNGTVLQPYKSCVFSIKFSPAENGSRGAVLILTLNPDVEGIGELPLAGVGGPASIPTQTAVGPPATQFAPPDDSPTPSTNASPSSR